MYPVSARFRAAMQGSHDAVSFVQVLQGGHVAATLQPTAGNVTATLYAPITRRMTASLADPDGTLTPDDAMDLLSPFGTELIPYRGVQYDDGTQEVIPLGVFRLVTCRSYENDGGVAIDLTGFDRAFVVEGQSPRSLPIQGNTLIEDAIPPVVRTKLPTADFDLQQTGYRVLSLVVNQGDDVWAKARALADGGGCRLYFYRDGVCTLRSFAAQLSDTVALSYVEGEGATFWGSDRTLDSQQVVNDVIVVGTHSGLASPVQAEAADVEPTSPTYIRGPYGVVAEVVQSEVVATVGAAQALANNTLAQTLGATESMTFQAVPNPALDEGDVVSITRARLHMTDRQMLISEIVMPLMADQAMTVTCRQNLLTPDGRFAASTLQDDA